MKQFFDAFPGLIFIVVFAFFGNDGAHEQNFLIATAATLAASTLQILIGFFFVKDVPLLHKAIFGLTLFTGGITLLFQDSLFFKLKTSIINLIFAFILIYGHISKGKNYIQRLAETSSKKLLEFEIKAPNHSWKTLNYSFVAYFIFVAVSNWFVTYGFDTETWVFFKYFILIPINLVFYGWAFYYLYQFIPEDEKERLLSAEKQDKN